MNKRHYEAAAQLNPPSVEAAMEWYDMHWTALTAEPGGVDYLEIEAPTRALWVVPHGCAADRVLIYAHGGGFVGGSIFTHRKLVGHIAKAIGCRALVYSYGYAPTNKHPHQVDTATEVYRWLLAQGVEPKHIAMAGDSAGAILSLGVVQRARSAGLPLPAAIVLLSGWLDMACTGASFETNKDKDVYFTKGTVSWLVATFLGDGDRRDPLASPLYADLAGFPPIFLQAGADETLVDDSRMFAERAKAAGVDVRLDIVRGMLHTFQMMAGRASEADDAIRRCADWVRPRLGLGKRSSEAP